MSEDYFSLLGLDMSFSIDLDAMERNYVLAHGTMHPDCFVDSVDKESAARRMAKINEAYLVLKSPLARAEYILKMTGTQLSDSDRNRIVSEVFDLQDSQNPEFEVQAEIAKCNENMEKFFSGGEMYMAAQQVEKLKYLRKLCGSGAICNF
ncbi:MAG: Fe-S protein assembly co-chaperone HscB [Anaplasma sp.]